VALQISSSWFPAKLRRISSGGSFWQARYYDFNVWSERKRVEKLRYTSQCGETRPVGEAGRLAVEQFLGTMSLAKDSVVEIESHWTARKRERMGIYPTTRRRGSA
jgi:hypothetical protein